jgi:ABC-type glutathione transport system ATPase component
MTRRPILTVEGLVKRYRTSRLRGPGREVTAVDGVSLSIFGGTTLAIVGSSGSGKSTLALCLACLERPTSGKLLLGERNLAKVSERELQMVRPQIQMVFQDPTLSLNPRYSVLELVSEPLAVQGRLARKERELHARTMLARVGLSPDLAVRKPAELSGGQRQRIAIARVLALNPQILILDEALSALDCSVQAQIANLLLELRSAFGLTMIFISHDLSMAAHLADEIAVMDRGRIVEHSSVEKILRSTDPAVTRSLLGATPRIGSAVAEMATLR